VRVTALSSSSFLFVFSTDSFNGLGATGVVLSSTLGDESLFACNVQLMCQSLRHILHEPQRVTPLPCSSYIHISFSTLSYWDHHIALILLGSSESTSITEASFCIKKFTAAYEINLPLILFEAEEEFLTSLVFLT
jgi:hypothetical protein